MAGNTDKPIENKIDDVLGVNRYIDGISNFIKVCDTPMTMAIQGDWGSGKTSFMNMISGEISDEVVTVWFNTWQFSQFSLGESLALTLLTTLVDCLDVGGAYSDDTKQTIKKLGKIAVNVGNNVAASLTGIDVVESLKRGMEADNIIKDVTNLKVNFQKCINGALKSRQKDKLVVFIDDLDRLPPEKAVEVLEVLKLFLDCDSCVFVLAIDYDVVCRGVSKKYGENFDAKKGRSFFDKIIQVPFKMPIAQYEIDKYIKITLENMDFIADNSKVYVDLISKSIGYNPRGMKRILNAFLLLKMVYGSEELKSAKQQVLLFSVLCLQMSFEKVYDYIVANEELDVNAELMSSIAELENSDGNLADAFFDEMKEMDDNNSEGLKSFMSTFCKTMVNSNNEITDDEFESLIDILKISATTSSMPVISSLGNGKSGRGVRYGNQFDESFAYHSIAEDIEKTNAPAGWKGCKLDGYKLFDVRHEASNFATLVVQVLSILYKKNPDKFTEIRDNSEQYGLYGLFQGSKSKNCLVAPKIIPDTEYSIESKNSYDAKVLFLRKILTEMGYNASDLSVNIKLAHRVSE